MGTTGTSRASLDDRVAAHLPLVYTIVRRALAGHPGAVDDVVQETMLLALRRLPTLREPGRLRVWLGWIAVRQAGAYLRRERTAARRRASPAGLADAPDADDFEDLTALRLELSAQRRQVGRAVGWLDPEDRVLWSLWWLEIGEELTRAELAAALGTGAAYAGVRIQRLRARIERARALVAALDARPRCAWLDSVVAGWDGIPSPLWRKRIGRHVRSCVACARAGEGMLDTERLLTGFALLPVPASLAAAFGAPGGATTTVSAARTVAGGAASAVTAGAAKAGWPVAKLAAGALVAGVAVTAVAWPRGDQQPLPADSAAASLVAPAPLPLGPVSLELVAAPGRYLGTDGQFGVLVTPETALTRRRATFEVVPGLAYASCYSLRADDGQYLRHSSWRLRLGRDEGTPLFRADATFCPIGPGEVQLESSNYRGYFIRREGDQWWVRETDGTAAFRTDSTFRVRPALA
ncbi:sigma-70 family RNA polymerase sigma factor [Dactylosporangium sp. CA-139066]|uniref:sigma-70 family RNA polymerase sigma factor n=1 Tax=Dactylosporangium sp. CA-139066 TaxID=3239930 RepID=UPI003D912204